VDSNLAMWALIVGTVLPPLLAIVQQPIWTQTLRTFVLVVASLVAGAGTAYFAGQLDGTDITTSVLIVLVTGIATYKGLWQSSGIAPAIEAATSPKAYSENGE